MSKIKFVRKCQCRFPPKLYTLLKKYKIVMKKITNLLLSIFKNFFSNTANT